jgi:hypothetical protein
MGANDHEKFQIKYQHVALLDAPPFWEFLMARDDRSMTDDELTYHTYFSEVVRTKQTMRIRGESLWSFTSSCLTLAQSLLIKKVAKIESLTWGG